jgi:hypothetical protein
VLRRNAFPGRFWAAKLIQALSTGVSCFVVVFRSRFRV